MTGLLPSFLPSFFFFWFPVSSLDSFTFFPPSPSYSLSIDPKADEEADGWGGWCVPVSSRRTCERRMRRHMRNTQPQRQRKRTPSYTIHTDTDTRPDTHTYKHLSTHSHTHTTRCASRYAHELGPPSFFLLINCARLARPHFSISEVYVDWPCGYSLLPLPLHLPLPLPLLSSSEHTFKRSTVAASTEKSAVSLLSLSFVHSFVFTCQFRVLSLLIRGLSVCSFLCDDCSSCSCWLFFFLRARLADVVPPFFAEFCRSSFFLFFPFFSFVCVCVFGVDHSSFS